MAFEEMAILILDGQVESPKISTILVRRVFFRLINDAELHPMCEGCRHSHQVKEAETNTLEKALFAAVAVIALLDASAQIHFGPRGRIQFAKIIVSVKLLFAEVEFPHVLGHG